MRPGGFPEKRPTSALELMALTRLGKFVIGDKPKGMPKPRAKASASRRNGIAWVGIEQPSVPTGVVARSCPGVACSAAAT